jgi:hypothetical protein
MLRSTLRKTIMGKITWVGLQTGWSSLSESQFGHEGLEPVVKGTNIAIVEDGKIKILFVALGKKSVVSDAT